MRRLLLWVLHSGEQSEARSPVRFVCTFQRKERHLILLMGVALVCGVTFLVVMSALALRKWFFRRRHHLHAQKTCRCSLHCSRGYPYPLRGETLEQYEARTGLVVPRKDPVTGRFLDAGTGGTK